MSEERDYWQRRVSRRRVLRGAALGGAGLAAAAVVGCGDEKEKPRTTPPTTPPAAQPAAKEPKRGGVFSHRMANEFLWAGYDPHVGNQAQGDSMSMFYQSLLRRNPRTVEPEPQLASKWEQPSQTEYILRLASGVKWHNKPPANSRKLTSADVVFSLNRVRTDDPRFINRLLLSSIDKVEAIDEASVKITTKAPDATLLANLADSTVAILAPEVVERAGKFATADTAVGTGPFIFQSVDDVTASAVRNADYWKAGHPYLDGVKVQRMPDPQVAWAGFLTGNFHVVLVPGQEVKSLQEGKKYPTGWWKDQAPQVLWVHTKRKPFDDPRVYKALRLLIDHKEMITGWVEVFFGPGSGVYTSHLPHLLDAWDYPEQEYIQARNPLFLEWKQPKDDAAKEALSLLSASGFTKDNPLKFTQYTITGNPWGTALAQLTQAQWQKFSQGTVKSELKLEENVALYNLQIKGEFEVAGPLGRASMYEPDQALSYVYHTKGGQNFGKYGDPQLDAKIENQRRIFDRPQRKAAILEILTFLLQNAPYTSPCSRDLFWAWQSKVNGFAPEPIFPFAHQYEDVWLDA